MAGAFAFVDQFTYVFQLQTEYTKSENLTDKH